MPAKKKQSQNHATPSQSARGAWRDKYIEEIGKRASKSKIYKKYQLIGLEIAKTLEDEAHRSLYMKLAKQWDGEFLLRQAKDVASRKNIKNMGAYFMSVIHASENDARNTKKRL